MNDDLKPCPFCGGTDAQTYHYQGVADVWLWEAYCVNDACGATLKGYATEAQAVKDWNTRPGEDALRARVAALEAQWAAVPWLDIHLALYGAASALQRAIERDIGDEATIGKALTRFDALAAWLDANRPQEASNA